MAETPKSFLCPLTEKIMDQPYMSRSGSTFERSAILQWLDKHDNRCPITEELLPPASLIPNRALKVQIQAFLNCNGRISKQISSQDFFIDPEDCTCVCVDDDENRKEQITPVKPKKPNGFKRTISRLGVPFRKQHNTFNRKTI